MGTVIVIAGFGVFFALFALLGPAERSKPCGGRKAGQGFCGHCPRNTSSDSEKQWGGCPGGRGS